jgi:hypothetical protein
MCAGSALRASQRFRARLSAMTWFCPVLIPWNVRSATSWGGGRLLPRDRISGLASAPWQAVSCLVLIRDDGRAGGLGLTDTMELPAGYGASRAWLARRPSCFVSVDDIYKCYAR